MKDLPEDRIWRAGENQVTTLDTQTALNIGGKPVPAGKYSLYVHAPAQGDWALVVNKNLGIPLGEIWAEAPAEMKKELWPRLDGYSKVTKDEVARVAMKKGTGAAADVFTITIKGDALTLSWGDARPGPRPSRPAPSFSAAGPLTEAPPSPNLQSPSHPRAVGVGAPRGGCINDSSRVFPW